MQPFLKAPEANNQNIQLVDSIPLSLLYLLQAVVYIHFDKA